MGVWVIFKIKKMENYIGFKKDCFYGKLFVIAIYPHFIFRINNKMIGINIGKLRYYKASNSLVK